MRRRAGAGRVLAPLAVRVLLAGRWPVAGDADTSRSASLHFGVSCGDEKALNFWRPVL